MTSLAERPAEETAVAPETTMEALAASVDEALRAASTLTGAARATADAVRESIEAVHRAALITIVRRVRQDEAGRAALQELLDDPLVRMVFSLHGIIRTAPATTPAPEPPTRSGPVLIPLSSIGRPRDGLDGWMDAGDATAVTDGAVTRLDVMTGSGGRLDVVVVRIGARMAAFLNQCAHQALPLDDAVLDAGSGTLTCPWHGFSYDALTGECLSAPGATLEPLAVRVRDGRLWVRADP
ncbi:MAG TPA: Rieske (2Fe-2S) protein [Actinomycetes bacterium]|nr:Rieske (2Fe-2S) protein [Actinomycetes bacterium]